MFERLFKRDVKPTSNARAARQARRHDPKHKEEVDRLLTTSEKLAILEKSRARLRQVALEEGLIAQ